MASIEKDRIIQFRGQDMCDREGERLGKIEEIYLDAETREPEWALVHTGLFGTKRTFVPLGGADEADGSLRVPFAKDMVKDAPKVEPNGQLTESEEAELFRHYGLAPDAEA
jgi:sporulation protein YlmC with PRC-barrel domain